MNRSNPLEQHLLRKEAAKVERKEKELELWQRWRKTKKPEHLEPLLKAYEPVVQQAMYKWRAKTVPPTAFKADLQTHLIKAFESYDPKKGAALNTHVHYRLQKAMRYNLKHQNLAYIPAGQAKLITPIVRAQEELKERYGRDPTSSEVASHLQEMEDEDFRNITAKRVDTVLRAQRRDVPASRAEEKGVFEERFPGFEDQQIAVASQILPEIFPKQPEMHTLFGHVFGVNGHEQITSTSALAKKMKKTDQQISHMKTTMGQTLRRHMGLDNEED